MKKMFFLVTAVVLFLLTMLSMTQAAIVDESQDYKQGIYDISYPQFSGITSKEVQEKINREMIEFASKFAVEQNTPDMQAAVMRYKVRYVSDTLLSLTVETYFFAGGAHGLTFLEGFTYDLQTGQRYNFADLYPFGESARESINQQIREQIAQKDIPTFGPFAGVSDKPQFFINKHGQPIIFFQQYEIGPYVIGIQKFAVIAEKKK